MESTRGVQSHNAASSTMRRPQQGGPLQAYDAAEREGPGASQAQSGKVLTSGLDLNFDKRANSWVIYIIILMQRDSSKDPKGLGHIRNLGSPKGLHQRCPIELQYQESSRSSLSSMALSSCKWLMST